MNSCNLCGKSGIEIHLQTLQYTLLVPTAKVCHECAEIVANAYHKAHSGRWLTWPNPQTKFIKKRTISAKLRKQVFERDAYRCKHCGSHKDLCADHIFPEVLGGEATLENLQTLCRPCNSRKGATVQEDI